MTDPPEMHRGLVRGKARCRCARGRQLRPDDRSRTTEMCTHTCRDATPAHPSLSTNHPRRQQTSVYPHPHGHWRNLYFLNLPLTHTYSPLLLPLLLASL